MCIRDRARAAAHAAGLPFSEKAYRDGEEPDPYLFDGSRSMEDYELMHRMIENERSERMEETILRDVYKRQIRHRATGLSLQSS